MKLLKIVTTHQSCVTILATKLSALSRREGVDLHVASSLEDPTDTRPVAGTHFVVNIPRSIRPLGDIAAVVRLWRYIRARRFDLVHTHTAKAGFVGAMAGRLAGVPVVHTFHGLPFYEGQGRMAFRIYRFLEVLACRLRKLVFTQNRRDYDILRGMKAVRCPVVYEGNGVCIDDIVANAERDRNETEAFIEPGTLTVVCVARLEPVKRLGTVIEAMRVIGGTRTDIRCLIAGKGPRKESLQNQIDWAGLSSVVRIIYTPHIHALLAKADLVVLSSEKEGIPRALMEAMALGKAVVATRVLGTDELVVDGETGVLVPLGDQEAFTGAIAALLDDPSKRKRLGEAGRRRVMAEYDDRRVVELWMRVYGEL